MAIVIRICVLLMILEIADTKEWRNETSVNGGNVTVCMDGLQINRRQILQIHFASFISTQHVSNVMIYNPVNKHQTSVNINYTGRIEMLQINNQHDSNELLSYPVKNQSDKISVHKDYTGGIEGFKMNNISLSFLLLHVTFMDSGTYTVSTMEDSVVRGQTRLIVSRHNLVGQNGDSMTITFMCNKTNISSIKVEMLLFKVIVPVAIYDVSHANCTEFGDVLKNRIESCLFNGITFALTIRNVTWLETGKYVAWDDMKFLLDSIFIEIEETKTSGLQTVNGPTDSSKFAKQTEDTKMSSLESSSAYVTIPSTVNGRTDLSRFAKENNKPAFLLISAVVVVVVAAFLATIAFWMIRHRKVPATETERKSNANSSANLIKNANDLIPPETSRLVLGTNDDAVNLTDLNKGQANVSLKEDNIIHRRFDCADSSTRTTRNLQIYSQAHLYDYISEIHDDCLPWESNLCLSPHRNESVAEHMLEYDYVVQHSFMTLRPPAPDPVVTRKSKVRDSSDHSISWYKRQNLKSTFRWDPSYALINKDRNMESNYTVTRSEPGRCYLVNQLAPSSYFELECIRATGTMNSPSWLRYGVAQNWRNVENLNSTNCVPKQEVLKLRGKSKHQRVAQGLNYDVPRCHFDLYSMDRSHRKSQSLNDMTAIESIRWSRRRSAMSCMKFDCYDSL